MQLLGLLGLLFLIHLQSTNWELLSSSKNKRQPSQITINHKVPLILCKQINSSLQSDSVIIIMTANCPYNPAHIMPVQSLLRHLYRCTATNKGQFAQCRFNQLHIYRKEVISHHQKECPDNKKKDKQESSWKNSKEEDSWNVSESRIDDWDHEQPSQVAMEKKSTRNTGREKKPRGKYDKEWSSEQDEQQKPNPKQQKKLDVNKKEQKNQAKDVPFVCDQSIIKDVQGQNTQKKKKPILQDFQ